MRMSVRSIRRVTKIVKKALLPWKIDMNNLLLTNSYP